MTFPWGRRAALLFAAAFLFRIICAIAARHLASDTPGGPFNYPDSLSYRAIARSLVETGTFAEGDLRANRPPLYPLFLAALLGVAGDGFWTWTLPQAAIGAATCLWLVPVGRALASERAGWCAAWILAFWPHHAAYTPLALSETLFLFLFVAHAACATGMTRLPVAVAAGILGGLAALTRPATLLFTPLVFLAGAGAAGKRDRRASLVALAAFLATLAPWTLRNRLVLGDWIPVSAKFGQDLHEGNCPEATGGPVSDRVRWPDAIAALPEAPRDAALGRQALLYMADHPARTAWLFARKALRTWSPVPNDPRHRTVLITGVLAATFGTLVVLACLGARRIAWTRDARIWFVGLPLFLTVLHGFLIGSVRYRLPAEPFLAVLAGAFLVIPRREPA